VLEVSIDTELKRKLGSNLLLFFTNVTRKASSILEEQKKSVNKKLEFHHKIKELALKSFDSLMDTDINKIGDYLKENWELKKKLASAVSNTEIDRMYNSAIEGGASGAKISGAGGGGFLLVYCERNKQDRLREAKREYRELPFLLEKFGSRIIFNQSRYEIK
jgi:D-glycero-alpha-D-manno-heptose-7-phosphate kinase